MSIFERLKKESKHPLSVEKEAMICRVVDKLLHPQKNSDITKNIQEKEGSLHPNRTSQNYSGGNGFGSTAAPHNGIGSNQGADSDGSVAINPATNPAPKIIDEPGLLLGKVQCGKTDTFVKIIGLAFDEGVDIAVVMTKGTNALATQTLKRLQNEFRFFEDPEDLNQIGVIVDDIRNRTIVGFKSAEIRDNKIILVVMKEDDNITALINLFQKNEKLRNKTVLLVDDEADFASRGYRPVEGNRQEIELGTIANLIDQFRTIPAFCPYLLVTATPYSIILQPRGYIELNRGIALPFRPSFVEMVPIHDKYIGGEQYFVESQDSNSMFSHLYIPVSEKCMEILGSRDRRYLNNPNISPNLNGLLKAIFGYLIATAIRSIQNQNKRYRSSAAFHVQTENNLQSWEKDLIEHIIVVLKEIVNTYENSGTVNQRFIALFDEIYDDFNVSTEKANTFGKINLNGSRTITHLSFPSKQEVWAHLHEMFEDDDISVQLVNTTQTTQGQNFPPFLNLNTGQLKLTSKANIFIGGLMLDRGITIDNMLCFFYGRNPQTAQQDTVLQHARFYGARSLEDMAVTRLYTTERIHNNLVQIHDLDEYVREWFASGNYNTGASIPIATGDGVIPTGRQKTLITDTYIISPGKRFLPTGMIIKKGTYKAILNRITQLRPICSVGDFIKVPLQDANDILDLIKKSYIYRRGDNFDQRKDMDDVISALNICARQGNDEVWILHRTNRHMSRERSDGTGWIDAPDDGRTDTRPSKAQAVDSPVLMLIGEQGRKSEGWETGEPFYWPVIVAQKNIRKAIFPSNMQKI